MTGHVTARRKSQTSDLDLSALRLFVAVARTGSFVAGGKALGLSRSAAGKAIARLEAHLGTRLLHRTTRHVSLTPDGHYFVGRCNQILQDVEETEARLRQNTASPTGTLRLSVPETWGKIVILPLLKTLMEEWPGLNIEVNFTDRIVDLVEEGFDLGIRMGSRAKDSQYIARVIQRTSAQIYASPAYINHHGLPVTISELAEHQRLIYGLSPASEAWELFDDSGAMQTVDAPCRLRFDSGEALRAAALEGIGIVYLPAFLVEPYVKKGQLVRLLPRYRGNENLIYAIYPSRKLLSPRVRLFIDRLTDILTE